MKNIINSINEKYLIVGIGVVAVILVIVLLINGNNYIALFWGDGGKFQNEYEELNGKESTDGKEYPSVEIDGNKIKYLNLDEVLDILDKGTAAIYIGYAECVYCRSAVQVLVDTARNSKLDYVYYLDISDIWDVKKLDNNGKVITKQKAKDGYDKLLKELGEEYTEEYILKDKNGNDVKVGERRVSVPLVIFVVNGDIVSSNVGTLFSQYDPYTPLDEDQVKGLSEIYSYGIKDVVNALNDSKKEE